MPKSREWHLVARPHGWPKPEDFALRETEVPEPGPGEILVRNLYVSVDPYMRGRMNEARSYAEPYRLDQPMHGGAVGRVVASAAEGFAPGDHVLHPLGWREYALAKAEAVVKVDPDLAPLSTYLGVLGMTGLTAYAGLLRVAGLKEGDVVFVSGAAGAVGSQVGQIARLKGASRVIGSAGSDEKVKLLVEEYGFDAAFNYKNGPVAEQLAAAAPDGIDVYFDNVGGEHLEAAIGALNLRGRVAVCGMIAIYNATEPAPAPATCPGSSRTGCASRASSSATTTTCSRSSSRRSAAGSARAGCTTARPSSTGSRTTWRPSSASCAATTPGRCWCACPNSGARQRGRGARPGGRAPHAPPVSPSPRPGSSRVTKCRKTAGMSTAPGSCSHCSCRPSMTATSSGAACSGVRPPGSLSPYWARRESAAQRRTRV